MSRLGGCARRSTEGSNVGNSLRMRIAAGLIPAEHEVMVRLGEEAGNGALLD
jgi:hypothetical protein